VFEQILVSGESGFLAILFKQIFVSDESVSKKPREFLDHQDGCLVSTLQLL